MAKNTVHQSVIKSHGKPPSAGIHAQIKQAWLRSCVVMGPNDDRETVIKNLRFLRGRVAEGLVVFTSDEQEDLFKFLVKSLDKKKDVLAMDTLRAWGENQGRQDVVDMLTILVGKPLLRHGDLSLQLTQELDKSRADAWRQALMLHAQMADGHAVVIGGREYRGPSQASAFLVEEQASLYGAKKDKKLAKHVDKELNERYVYIASDGSVRDRERPFERLSLANLGRLGGEMQVWCSPAWNGKRTSKQRTVFEPRLDRVQDDEFNLYDPALVMAPSGAATQAPPEFLALVKCLAGAGAKGQDEAFAAFRYIIDWIAWGLRNQGDGHGVALVLYGAKGSGKNMLGRILARIYGPYYTQIGQDLLEGKFNGWAEGKLLVFANEIGSSFFKDKRASSNKIKGLVVGDRLAVERKGTDSYEAENFANWLFASNEVVPVLVEDGDRRFSIIRGLQRLDAFQAGLGAKLHRLIEDDSWVQQVVDFLGGVDLSKYAPDLPFDSAERDEVVTNSRSQVETWVAEALPPAGEHPTETLYQGYRSWCEGAGVTPLSLPSWQRELPHDMPAGKKYLSGKQVRTRFVPNRGQSDKVVPFVSDLDVIQDLN